MDSGPAPVLPQPRDELLLQRFRMAPTTQLRPLYWQAERQVDIAADGALEIAAGASLSFDTYFNGFFEGPWRLHTRLGALVLRVTVSGACDARIYRRNHAGRELVHEQVLTGGRTVDIQIGRAEVNFRQNGVLGLELTARGESVSFVDAAWLAVAQQDRERAAPVGLALAFCTFNREADIIAVLDSVIGDAAVLDRLARIFVVNQGRPALDRHPRMAALVEASRGKLRIIEQDNFGGAGGFGRGMLAAFDDPAVTHVALLDDDVAIETDSLLRMAAFFALAAEDIVLGGHMLDKAQPTRLYEAGGVISDRDWTVLPQHHCCDIADPAALTGLNDPRAVHFNGWWCCGYPLALIRRAGLPLPCFIRGDDLEYGWRLHQQGVATVSVPGIAVWHEPFYLRIGGWQLYYEIRNILIAASLHAPFVPREVARRMARQFLTHLLTYRYYSAALVLRGIQDFLAGPDILWQHPLMAHRRLDPVKAAYPVVTTPRCTVLTPQRLTSTPRGAWSNLVGLVWATARQAIKPAGPSPVRLLQVQDLAWGTMRRAEHVAVETWWDEELPTFQRSRLHARALLRTGFWVILALYRRAPAMATQWQAAAPTLISVPFWRSYLQRSPAPQLDADRHALSTLAPQRAKAAVG